MDRPSIVVLPFDNMSGDPEQSYFSDGISEDVITELSKVPGLFVIARNSAFVYKGKAQNLPDVAVALGVRYLLEGSVRKAGKRVRITAQLIDGHSGGHLWAERYDRELEDIFAVQDEVTDAIVGQLSLKLGPDEKDRVSRHGTTNMEAWDLYLRGREAAWMLTRGSCIEASKILNEVVSLDPGFAAAHAMLGFTRVSQHVNGWDDANKTGLADGLADAETAIGLDSEEPLGHFAHALGLQYAGRLEEALAAGERAVAIDANFSYAHGVIGSSVLFMGRAEAALEHLDIAMRLDPYHPNVLLHLCALAHYMLGDYRRSRTLLEQRMALKVETDSTPFVLAACLGRLGEPEAAAKAWRQVFKANADFSIAQRRQAASYRDIRHFEDIVEGLRLAGIDPDAAP
jgi:TolB-like protein